MQSVEFGQSIEPEKVVYSNSALHVLAEMPSVDGSELDKLLAKFHQSVEVVSGNGEAFEQMCVALHEINPHFSPETYSSLPEANVLANVVAGLYAPLIHGFSKTVLENIHAGRIPEVLVAPPRDSVPLAVSLETMAEITGVGLTILKPPITRKTAGIPNNQSDEIAKEDPLFGLMINQTFNSHSISGGITELETGIYSTTSLKVAHMLKELGIGEYVALKFYGLGPNLSYVHALLSGGNEWVAEKAESAGLVDAIQIAQLMVLLDSMEEFGMQNIYQTITKLKLNGSGKVEPVINTVDEKTLEIARATNQAIAHTSGKYLGVETGELSLGLLGSIPTLVTLSQQGYPFTLTAPIPPMDNKEAHFANIRAAQVFSYPKLILSGK
jgi:hypothetical protein